MTERPIDRLRGFARDMRREPTPTERIMWRMLRAKRLADLKFKRQVPLGPYIADFVSLGRRLVIELDGSHHGTVYDAKRDVWLAAQGFKVLRFSNREILENADGVCEVILQASGVERG